MRLVPLISILMLLAVPAITVSPAHAGKRTLPCAFPDGWNPTDFHRQQMHIPPDAHHYCVVNGQGQVVDKSGRPTT